MRMKLSEMRQLLSERNIQLTKSLGQNFLHDTNVLQKIVAAGELQKSDSVLEIGPGLGPLTELLLAQAGKVFAIEKDKRLVDFLQERFKGANYLQLLHADALDYLRDQPQDWSRWKMISNLPYSVASPILVELAQMTAAPERIVATLQLEVVNRIVAQPGTGDYGLLTLLLQMRYKPKEYFKIPAGCFFPTPDVESATVTLVRHPTPLVEPGLQPTFEKVVRRGFSQRRKMMFKLLKGDWQEASLQEAFALASIDRTIRAERVSVEQFAVLAKTLRATRSQSSASPA
jgi:16S rRNA (adenine1518-N6/adenine1519-N6)-dimethyltransferase